uniref:Magnesium transporter NIPA2 n=1 Tax=Megaselia scalaris TaxID=36166 RepID=T1GWM7_MEGSC
MMGVGEAANFAAYAFAPASLVTPLGALSVLVSAVMASRFLKEKLICLENWAEREIDDLEALFEKLIDPGFVLYIFLIISTCIFVAMFLAPKYGHTNVSVYIYLCSGIGSLTVMSCKALGLAIRETVSGKNNEFSTWMPWFLIIITVIFIAIQMNYLNKALDIFNTGIVSPIYYVMFTTLVIIASAILFKEFQHMSAEDILGDICGFLIVIVAVFMLNAFKDVDISLNDMRGIARPKHERLPTFDDDVYIRGSDKESNSRKVSYGTNEDFLMTRNA